MQLCTLCLPLASDLFKYRFFNCKLINSTFLHNKEGCILDFSDDFNNAYMIYFVNFLGTLAVLPGNIVSALLMDKIGRLRMLGKEVGRVHVAHLLLARCCLLTLQPPPPPPCSGLQRHFLRQLLLPDVWQQRVGDDRPLVPVWRYQHRLLERPGRDHGGALPLR